MRLVKIMALVGVLALVAAGVAVAGTQTMQRDGDRDQACVGQDGTACDRGQARECRQDGGEDTAATAPGQAARKRTRSEVQAGECDGSSEAVQTQVMKRTRTRSCEGGEPDQVRTRVRECGDPAGANAVQTQTQTQTQTRTRTCESEGAGTQSRARQGASR